MADLCSLAFSNDQLDLCSVPQLPHPLLAKAVHMFPMIWRFFPTLDTQVDAFMSRDLDSIVTPREVKAVEEWVQSGKTLHTMRDHPQHNFPMLGGMWGVQMPRRSKTWRAVWKAIFGPTSLPTPSARVTEAPRVQTRLCRVGMCGEDSLEGWCSTTATFALNILERWDFHPKDQTPQQILSEEKLTESNKTLNAQHSAEESKAGGSASFLLLLNSCSS